MALKPISLEDKIFNHTDVQSVTWHNWLAATDSELLEARLSKAIRASWTGMPLDIAITPFDLAGVVTICARLGIVHNPLCIKVIEDDQYFNEYKMGSTIRELVHNWNGVPAGFKLFLLCLTYRAFIEKRSNFFRSTRHISVAGAVAVASAVGVVFTG